LGIVGKNYTVVIEGKRAPVVAIHLKTVAT